MKSLRVLLTTALVLVGLTVSALADSRLSFKTTEGTGSSLTNILIAHGKVRTDPDKATSVILEPATGTMIMVDHARKTFTRVTKADLDQLMKAFADMMKQMEAQMASATPEVREQMKAMMSGRGGIPGMPAAATIADTGERSTVAGRSCRVFRTTIGTQVVSEMCMGDPSGLEVAPADRATMTGAIAMMKDIGDRLAKTPAAQFVKGNPFASGLVPLRSTDIVNGQRNTSEFTGVSTAAIPADQLDIPAGYKEQKLQLPGGRGGNAPGT